MELNINDRNYNFPDFFIVGAARSGTTTLFHLLSQHPNVFIPRVKEPFYFSFGDQKPKYTDFDFTKDMVWKREEYIKLYEKAPQNVICGDASTSYLYLYMDSIKNIKQIYQERSDDLKIIIVLRNPVDRAYSHYNLLIRDEIEDLPFEKAIVEETINARKYRRWGFDYLEYGNYYKQVRAYLEAFKNVKVLFFDEIKNTDEVAMGLAEFLELEQIKFDTNIYSNAAGQPKNRMVVRILLKSEIGKFLVNLFPKKVKLMFLNMRDRIVNKMLFKQPLSNETRHRLFLYFKSDIEQLETLLKVDLDHWKVRES